MKIVSADFVRGAVKPEQYPDLGVAEFAVYGKSNVGKSSLINFLVQRKDLVRTSRTPGRTQEINFFLINQRFCLADLPGTGYARLPGSIRRSLGPMLEEYLDRRKALAGIFYLLDLRREIGEEELSTLERLGQTGAPVVIIGTKSDKLGSNELHKTRLRWQSLFTGKAAGVHFTSSSKRSGREGIMAFIEDCLQGTPPRQP